MLLTLQVYDYDDFYFLTDPEQLIYSHFPHQKELQLLHNPLTVEEFEMLPLVKSYFFKCAMYFISHHKGVAETKNGESRFPCFVIGAYSSPCRGFASTFCVQSVVQQCCQSDVCQRLVLLS